MRREEHGEGKGEVQREPSNELRRWGHRLLNRDLSSGLYPILHPTYPLFLLSVKCVRVGGFQVLPGDWPIGIIDSKHFLFILKLRPDFLAKFVVPNPRPKIIPSRIKDISPKQ